MLAGFACREVMSLARDILLILLRSRLMFQRRLACLGVDGVLLSYFMFAISVNTALAACADKKVRPNSPCKTTQLACAPIGNNNGCMGDVEPMFYSDFQCDSPSTGQDCQGTGNFAKCTVLYKCVASGGTCVAADSPLQAYNAETKVAVHCAGGWILCEASMTSI